MASCADHFAALGLPINSSTADITAAFRRLALRHHPDKGGSKEAFQRIRTAYEALKARGPIARQPPPPRSNPAGSNMQSRHGAEFAPRQSARGCEQKRQQAQEEARKQKVRAEEEKAEAFAAEARRQRELHASWLKQAKARVKQAKARVKQVKARVKQVKKRVKELRELRKARRSSKTCAAPVVVIVIVDAAGASKSGKRKRPSVDSCNSASSLKGRAVTIDLTGLD